MKAARAALASLFLLAQGALAFHHHEAGVALRASGRDRSVTAISAKDDCALCSFQIQPRSSGPEPVSVPAPSLSVAVLSEPPSGSPRAAFRGRAGARAPPAA